MFLMFLMFSSRNDYQDAMEELVDVKEDVREALEAGKANGVTKVALVNAPKDILHGKSLGDIVGCTRCGSFFFFGSADHTMQRLGPR